MIRVLLAEDQAMVRGALSALLSWNRTLRSLPKWHEGTRWWKPR